MLPSAGRQAFFSSVAKTIRKHLRRYLHLSVRDYDPTVIGTHVDQEEISVIRSTQTFANLFHVPVEGSFALNLVEAIAKIDFRVGIFLSCHLDDGLCIRTHHEGYADAIADGLGRRGSC